MKVAELLQNLLIQFTVLLPSLGHQRIATTTTAHRVPARLLQKPSQKMKYCQHLINRVFLLVKTVHYATLFH